MNFFLTALILSLLFSNGAYAKCKKEEFKNYVGTSKGCIGMDYWDFKKSSHLWVKKIEKKTKVGAIVGEHDKNTYPSLSEQYFKLLEKNEIKGELLIINANQSFDYIFNNKEAIELGKRLVN